MFLYLTFKDKGYFYKFLIFAPSVLLNYVALKKPLKNVAISSHSCYSKSKILGLEMRLVFAPGALVYTNLVGSSFLQILWNNVIELSLISACAEPL